MADGKKNADWYYVPGVSVTFYGDSGDSIEELLKYNPEECRKRPDGPILGDELCDGHQWHYYWDGEKWR